MSPEPNHDECQHPLLPLSQFLLRQLQLSPIEVPNFYSDHTSLQKIPPAPLHLLVAPALVNKNTMVT